MISKEYERKQVLSKENFDECLLRLSSIYSCEEIIQINYYYDDEHLSLYKNGETLRIRQVGTKLTLETKKHKQYIGNIRVSDESSESITELPMNISMPYIEAVYIGNMLTIRKNYLLEGCTISLDHCFYLGFVDYEIEVETVNTNEGFSILDGIVSFTSNTRGKYTRFVDKLKDMKNEFL